MDLTEALIIAANAHKGQVDKGGEQYILHPIRVMTKCDTDEERIVALLHDVVEDTNITIDNLREYGFSEEVINAIDCLTRRPNESYDDFIMRVKTNELATKIKIFDIEDNMITKRLKEITEKDLKRLNKYSIALQMLVGEKRPE
jgi:(p)ppGpp synthase/HD superfamily hydrolase